MIGHFFSVVAPPIFRQVNLKTISDALKHDAPGSGSPYPAEAPGLAG
ncbi:MAG: hypothetical protein WDM87_15025 [Terracidiphilus sp.]